MRDLRDDVVWITGAGGGIGRALAREAVRRGAHVVLTDVSSDALEAARGDFTHDAPIETHALDVTDEASWDRVCRAVVDAHGGVDVLVHNAGLTVHGSVQATPWPSLKRVLDVDLLGPMLGTHRVLPHLLTRGGHLVFICSSASLFAVPTQTAYAAAKWGLRGFAASLGLEIAPHVGVTAVLPGTIATGFLRGAEVSDGPGRDTLASLMERFGTSPDRVARRTWNAVTRGRREIRVGWDAHAIAWTQALAPGLLDVLVGRAWRVARPQDAP